MQSADDNQSAKVAALLAAAGLQPFVADDLVDGLLEVAAILGPTTHKGSRNSHELCQRLADAADAIDSSVLAAAAGDVFESVLRGADFSPWRVAAIGYGVAKACEPLAEQLLPTAQLCLGLRVLALLLCPNQDACPAADQLSLPVLRALLAGPGGASTTSTAAPPVLPTPAGQ